MSLSDLASLGSFVSGVAVLASLGFLYFQMRQMTEQVRQAEKNQQANVHQARVARSSDQLFRIAEHSHLTQAYLKGIGGTDDITEEEVTQFAFLVSALLRSAEDIYFQFNLGLLDEASRDNNLGALRLVLSTRGGMAMWRVVSSRYDKDFVQRIEMLLPAVPTATPTIERWKKQLATIPKAALA